MSSSPPPLRSKVTVVVVARHGERTDYVNREAGKNWVAEHAKKQPWNPPLTAHGKEQATRLGAELTQVLSRLGLPCVSTVYSSPLLRCQQTAACTSLGPVHIEEALMESIVKQWYRSWALPESNGTWGGGPKTFSEETLHTFSKQPIQDLLQEALTNSSSLAEPIPTTVDTTYASRTKIVEPYTFPHHLESRKEQRKRMKDAVELLSQPGETILLVSHGGPVTHLFEELTEQPWQQHGESMYCCYSIYVKDTSASSPLWKPVCINQSEYLQKKNPHKDDYVTEQDS